MKKTMFITSVIMVVVMAIALTTSSLAWFSAAGQASVTTTALTVKAQSNSSTGLLISHDNLNFAENIELDTSSALMPLVPIKSSIVGAAATSAELNDALIARSFIGNKVASGYVIDPSIVDTQDANWHVAAQRTIFAFADGLSGGNVAPYTTGWYEDDLYIANMATGSQGKEVKIKPSIAFRYNNGDEYVNYTTVGQNAVYQSTHPTMYVAILADITDGDYEYAVGNQSSWAAQNWEPETWTTDKAAASLYDTDGDSGTPGVYISREKEDWEVVQIFSTASTAVDDQDHQTYIAATIGTGNVAANFASGYVTTKAVNNVANGALTKTSTRLAKAQEGANLGTAKKFKVVVWYDGASLNNNNSGFDFDFALTFTSVE